jgi:hypothetical protein
MESASAADPALYHFAGIVLAATLGALQGRADRAGPFWQIVVRLPGTLLHEVAHFLVAFITGGRPAGFTIIPHRTVGVTVSGEPKQVWVLGSVTVTNPSPIAALPSGCAPLLLLPLAWILYRNWFSWFPPDFIHTVLMYAAVVICCNGSLPSSQDIVVACSRPSGLLLYTLLGCCIWLICRHSGGY